MDARGRTVRLRGPQICWRRWITCHSASSDRYDEAESAAALAEALLQDIDVPAERIEAIVSKIRNELAPARRGLTNES
jgi:hypothetical protein